MMRLLRFALVLVALSAALFAHESLPGFLEINEQSPNEYAVFWRVPAIEGVPPAIAFSAPSGCKEIGNTQAPLTPGSLIQHWAMRCDTSLIGKQIKILDLDRTLLDVLVRVRFRDGREISHIARPLEASFVLEPSPENSKTDRSYLLLGIEHILYGIDHLLFVLGLLLLVESRRALIKTITAFTVAHTITLSLATVGLIRVSTLAAEAVIALSLVFVGYEMANKCAARQGFTQRHPWTVAFSFGLLHGLGFAATLTRLGLSSSDVPRALLLFNCGVELGQLAVVAAALSFFWSLRQLEIPKPRWADWGVSYAFGSVASFWFIQKCANLF